MSADPTFGIEIEIPKVASSLVSTINTLSSLRWEFGDDGSIRERCYTIDGIPIIPTRRGNLPSTAINNETVGLELISRAHKLSEWESEVGKVARFIGNIPTYGDSSIHVHMDIGNLNWKVLQNMAGWFYSLEAVMYRLSSLGTIHRGQKNSYKYARPLSCPIWWIQGSGNDDDDSDEEDFPSSLPSSSPVVNIKELLGANTATKFFHAYGSIDRWWGNLSHYCPQRLHGLNFVPVMRLGTAELRIFNGVYKYLPEVVDVCKAFYNLSLRESYTQVQPWILGTQPSDDDAEFMLYGVLGVKDTKSFKNMWNRSHWCKAPAQKNLLHHYRGHNAPSSNRMNNVFTINNTSNFDKGSADFIPFRRS